MRITHRMCYYESAKVNSYATSAPILRRAHFGSLAALLGGNIRDIELFEQ